MRLSKIKDFFFFYGKFQEITFAQLHFDSNILELNNSGCCFVGAKKRKSVFNYFLCVFIPAVTVNKTQSSYRL